MTFRRPSVRISIAVATATIIAITVVVSLVVTGVRSTHDEGWWSEWNEPEEPPVKDKTPPDRASAPRVEPPYGYSWDYSWDSSWGKPEETK